MISAGEIQKINIPTYLQVLGQLPNVSPDDIQTTQQILQNALDSSRLTTVEFVDSKESGWDGTPSIPQGAVQVVQIYHARGQEELQVPIVFDLSGKVSCRAKAFEAQLPASVVPYFVEGIFGAEGGDEIVLKKVEGVRDLYRCAIKRGGVKNCSWFDGAAKFVEAATLETEKKRKRVEKSQQSAETLWHSAEEMEEAARGWGDGDPDDIEAVMNRYAAYRYYNGTSDEVRNAAVRYEKAEEMIKAIAEADGGWPQFKKQHCNIVETGHHSCGSDETGIGIDYYGYSCGFGVTHEGGSSGSCVKEKKDYGGR